VAEDGGRLVGYLLYDVPRNEVSIKQLVIDPPLRHTGIAELLVEHLVSMVDGQRQWVGLKCSRDFELRRFWERVGFTPYDEVPGRAKEGSVLTLWRRDLGYPDLFGAAADADPRDLAVLDTVLVIRGAAGDAAVRDQLLAAWVDAEVRFGVVGHTYTEIDRRDDRADRLRNKRYADGLGRVTGEGGVALRIETETRADLCGAAAAYRGDIIIASQAAAAGARWMVTEDHKFRSRCGEAVARIADVDIVSVAELLIIVDTPASDDGYRPADLMGAST
jgi:predicted GNAT family acetyltransferase